MVDFVKIEKIDRKRKVAMLPHSTLCTFINEMGCEVLLSLLSDFNGVDFITVLSYRTVCKEQGTGLATVACTCALKRRIDVPLFVVATVTCFDQSTQDISS